MKLGVCYYPEHWPKERWPIDARLMHEAGLSVVRIADFAWSAIEPKEGEFNWEWLDDVIEILTAENLQVIMCTPTAAPPPWLCRAHPDILPVDEQGRRRRPGSRRHYCPNNPTYRHYARQIAAEMATRYGKHAGIVGWQIDNEFGCHYTARCYCPSCAEAFRGWLKAKYGTVNTLNEAWGTIFWSQVYGAWSEIDPPNLTVAGPNPSHVLDYDRFSSDSYIEYLNLQKTSLQLHIEEHQIITTNFMSRFAGLNYYDLADSIDLVALSAYPTGHAETVSSLYMPSGERPQFAYDVGDPHLTSLELTMIRGFKPESRFWIIEQQAGQVNWGVYNTGIRTGTVRLWTWHALAFGAEAVFYFRWRAGLFAQEQMHSGLLHHDASPAVGLKDLMMMADERDLMTEIASEQDQAKIALLLDYESLWAVNMQRHSADFDYMRLLFVYFRALQRLGHLVDIVSMDASLAKYQMVIAPTAFVATKSQSDSLNAFVEAGGTLLLGARSGFKTIDNQVTEHPLPGILQELVAITVGEWHALPPAVSFELDSSVRGLEGSATIWAEALQLPAGDTEFTNGNVRPLARYSSGPFASQTALSENRLGSGRALYLGWHPNDQQAEALLAHLASEEGINSVGVIPEGMVVARRGSHVILLNFSDTPLQATIQGQAVDVGPRDVKVVKSRYS